MKLINKIKSKYKQIKSNLKYNFGFLGVLNSPFVGLTTKWYFGKIQYGTPYFLPRKWVKCDYRDAVNAYYDKSVKPVGPEKVGEWLENYQKSYTKPIPIKYFGINFTSLGWKTKYDDYRFEWSPSLSIVIFGKQLMIWLYPKGYDKNFMRIDQYWEGWLNYGDTDKTKSEEEQVIELISKWSCTWVGGTLNNPIHANYFYQILKPKYHKYIK